MNQMGELLGSITRGTIVEALALSEKPLTSYRISKMYNMNVAKVYVAMKRLVALGVVKPSKGKSGITYLLLDEDLRRLALKFSARVFTYEDWTSQEAKKKRFRSGLSRVPLMQLGKPNKTVGMKPTRVRGELENLALLAKKKFDAKYHRAFDGAYDRVR